MFLEIIDDVANRVEGLRNVILAGTDGITVSKLVSRDEDELMVVEAAGLVKECQRFGREMAAGEVRELVFSFSQQTLVLQMVSDDYFLLGICSSKQRVGKLRYLLKVKSYECHTVIE